MEHENKNLLHPLHQVIWISRYLSLVLFIVLPFIGGYIGYSYSQLNTFVVKEIIYMTSQNLDTKNLKAASSSEPSNDVENSHNEGTVNDQEFPDNIPPEPKDLTNAFRATSDGCSDFEIYKTNEDNDMSISVYVNRNKLNLTKVSQVYKVEDTLNDISVHISAGREINTHFCNDLFGTYMIEQKFTASSGLVSISVSKDSSEEFLQDDVYTTTVILNDIVFLDKKSHQMIYTIQDLRFKDVEVGWLPG